MPDAMASRCMVADASPVSAITVAGWILSSRSRCRIFLVLSKPSINGIEMSASRPVVSLCPTSMAGNATYPSV